MSTDQASSIESQTISDGAAVCQQSPADEYMHVDKYVNENLARFSNMTDEEIEQEGVLVADHRSPHYNTIRANWKKLGKPALLKNYPIHCMTKFGSRFRPKKLNFSVAEQLRTVVKEIPSRKSESAKHHKSRIEWNTEFPDPMPLTIAAKYLHTSTTRIEGMRDAGVLTPVPGYDRNGQMQDCFQKCELDNVRECFRAPDQLNEKAVVEIQDGHIWVMRKITDEDENEDEKVRWEKTDLAQKSASDVAAHGRIFSAKGVAKEYAEQGLTRRRVLAEVRQGRLDAVEIYGFNSPVLTEFAVDAYLHKLGRKRNPRMKTVPEIKDELFKLHPEWFATDPKTGKLELHPEEKSREVYGILAGVEKDFIQEECVREAFDSPPTKNIKKPVRLIRNVYDWPRFLKILNGFDDQTKKAKKLFADGKQKSEIKSTLEKEGVRGERLRLVLSAAGITKKSPKPKRRKGAAKTWLEGKVKNGGVLFQVIDKEGGKFGGLRLAKKQLGIVTDYHTFGKKPGPGVPRYTVWRLPSHPRLTDVELQKAIRDFEASSTAEAAPATEDEQIVDRPAAGARSEIESHGKRMFKIGNSREFVLSITEDKVLRAFIGQPVMDNRELAQKAGVSQENARVTLHRLKSKYHGVFSPAISLPGKKSSGGYHVIVIEKRGKNAEKPE